MCKTVMMHLFNSYCKLILLFKNLSSLSHSRHAIFWKLFCANDVRCINKILHFMGYRTLTTKTDARRIVFFYERHSHLITL